MPERFNEPSKLVYQVFQFPDDSKYFTTTGTLPEQATLVGKFNVSGEESAAFVAQIASGTNHDVGTMMAELKDLLKADA